MSDRKQKYLVVNNLQVWASNDIWHKRGTTTSLRI